MQAEIKKRVADLLRSHEVRDEMDQNNGAHGGRFMDSNINGTFGDRRTMKRRRSHLLKRVEDFKKKPNDISQGDYDLLFENSPIVNYKRVYNKEAMDQQRDKWWEEDRRTVPLDSAMTYVSFDYSHTQKSNIPLESIVYPPSRGDQNATINQSFTLSAQKASKDLSRRIKTPMTNETRGYLDKFAAKHMKTSRLDAHVALFQLVGKNPPKSVRLEYLNQALVTDVYESYLTDFKKLERAKTNTTERKLQLEREKLQSRARTSSSTGRPNKSDVVQMYVNNPNIVPRRDRTKKEMKIPNIKPVFLVSPNEELYDKFKSVPKDNGFNRRKIYDAWYLDGKQRVAKLNNFLRVSEQQQTSKDVNPEQLLIKSKG